jgi:hypothetical protein
MATRPITFTLSGLDTAPDPDDVLHYGRALAARSGIALPEDARPTITQAPEGGDSYRIDISTELSS